MHIVSGVKLMFSSRLKSIAARQKMSNDEMIDIKRVDVI